MRTIRSAAALSAGLCPVVFALSVTAAVAAEHKYDPGDNVQFTYCYSHPPVLRIKPGDSVVTSTKDASNDVFAVTDKTLFPKLDLSKVNPQTGPFYIEGAEPGDTLVVHIDKIDFNRDWGWGGSIPYFGALAPEYKTMMITPPVPDRLFVWRIDRNRRVGTLDLPNSKIGKVEVPLRPFFGTIGTAPAGKECISSLVPGSARRQHGLQRGRRRRDHVLPGVRAGRAVHARRRSRRARRRRDRRRRHRDLVQRALHRQPDQGQEDQLAAADQRQSHHVDRQHAAADRRPAARLRRTWSTGWSQDYGFDKLEALQLLGQTAELEIANVVDPQYSVACTLDKKYLPK